MASRLMFSSRALFSGLNPSRCNIHVSSWQAANIMIKSDNAVLKDDDGAKDRIKSKWSQLMFKRKDVIVKEIVGQKALEVGDTVVVNKLVSVGDVDDFCELTGDYNTVHTESRIVHGALLNGLVSSVLGTVLPGPGSMVLSQHLEFPHSCVAPQCVTVSVTLTSVRKIITCVFSCQTMDGLEVMRGDVKLIKK